MRTTWPAGTTSNSFGAALVVEEQPLAVRAIARSAATHDSFSVTLATLCLLMQVAQRIIESGHGALVVEARACRSYQRRGLIQFCLVQLDDAAETGIIAGLRQVQRDIRLIQQALGHP